MNWLTKLKSNREAQGWLAVGAIAIAIVLLLVRRLAGDG